MIKGCIGGGEGSCLLEDSQTVTSTPTLQNSVSASGRIKSLSKRHFYCPILLMQSITVCLQTKAILHHSNGLLWKF